MTEVEYECLLSLIRAMKDYLRDHPDPAAKAAVKAAALYLVYGEDYGFRRF